MELSNETYNLSKAKLFFNKKDFDNVFPYHNQIHFKDPHYHLSSRILLAGFV
jgi:hypothetical protein